MTTKIINRSGSVLIITGILIAGSMFFYPDVTKPGFALRPAWIPVHFLLGVAALTGIYGLAGLHSTMIGKISTFGQWAFGVAILGNVLLAGLMFFVEVAMIPVLARYSAYQALLSRSGPLLHGTFGAMVLISHLCTALGFWLLAGYLVTTKTVSTVNGLLFFGAPLLAFSPPLSFSMGIIGGVSLGAAIIWLGVSIRTGTAHEALAKELRIRDECFIEAEGHT